MKNWNINEKTNIKITKNEENMKNYKKWRNYEDLKIWGLVFFKNAAGGGGISNCMLVVSITFIYFLHLSLNPESVK